MIIGCTREQLENEDFKNRPLSEEWDYEVYGVQYHLTPRMLLQRIGTDVCREVHPNTWINATMRDYKHIPNNSFGNRMPDDTEDIPYIYPNWIITDCRFPNEAKVIEDRGGIVIRVNRNIPSDDNHASETSLDDYPFKHVINNDGSIDDLINRVNSVLKANNIV